MRLLHTSDIHLGATSTVTKRISVNDGAHRAFKALIDLAIEITADLLIIAGDLFENNRIKPPIIQFVLQQLDRLDIPIVILPGNHDCLLPDSVFLHKDFTKIDSNIHIFKNPAGEIFYFPKLDVAVWGKPIISYGDNIRPLAGISSRNEEKWRIAVAHGYYVGASTNHEVSFQISEREIIESAHDYIALGHLPSFQCVCDKPVKAYYSGSPSYFGKVAIVDFHDANILVRPHQLPT